MILKSLFKEIEQFTKPLCSAHLYEKKIDNFKKIEESFLSRDEYCRGLPFQIHIEPSGYCNLLCPICPKGRGIIKRKGFLVFDSFEKILKTLSKTLTSIVISGFGEPLLNKDTTRMVALASKHSIATFMNTNGTVLLDHIEKILDARLTKINISLDGAITKRIHKYNEKSPFSNVVQAVKFLREKKDKGNYQSPIIQGQFIISDETVDEMENLKKWALELGVEKVNFKRKHPTMPDELERKKILTQYNIMKIIEQEKVDTEENLNWSQKDCTHPWDSFFLSCNGEISVCSFDPYLSNKFGNVNDDFNSIWNNEKIRMIRKWHSGKDAIMHKPCSKCNRLPGYLKQKDK
jgi:radical SAM protein with 4Fe4S-binding SPASM domain